MSDEENQYVYDEEYEDSYIENEAGGHVQSLLEQKDKDLMLAAELGKALLEKNTELERKLEQSSEELNQKIEDLEQEKYGLHLKLENVEGEYENTVRELQYDLAQLRDDLHKSQQHSHAGDKEKLVQIRELTQQNERLAEELHHYKSREKEQEAELQQLKNNRLVNISSGQAVQIHDLQDQVHTLTDRHSDMERHIQKLTEEKESILGLLEESADRVKVLEHKTSEQESELHTKSDEIEELLSRTSHLNNQVDQLTERAASDSSSNSMTLFSELTQLTGTNELAMATDSPINPYPPSMFGEDDIECDDDDFIMTSSSPTHAEGGCEFESQRQHSKMEGEMVHAYRHLRDMCRTIKAQMGDKLDTDVSSQASDDTGSLNGVVIELKDLVQGAMETANQTQSGHLTEIHSLQQRVGELESDLKLCQTNIHKIREQLHHRELQLQQRTHKLNELSNQVSSQHEDVKHLLIQRDKLQDMLTADKEKPQSYSALALLKHARRERDASNERRHGLEKELQQARYEVIVLNHQLMEAIQQKNSVSQLLDQWQKDMADLLGVQMDRHIKEAGLAGAGLAGAVGGAPAPGGK